jgi:hypothetical protein
MGNRAALDLHPWQKFLQIQGLSRGLSKGGLQWAIAVSGLRMLWISISLTQLFLKQGQVTQVTESLLYLRIQLPAWSPCRKAFPGPQFPRLSIGWAKFQNLVKIYSQPLHHSHWPWTLALNIGKLLGSKWGTRSGSVRAGMLERECVRRNESDIRIRPMEVWVKNNITLHNSLLVSRATLRESPWSLLLIPFYRTLRGWRWRGLIARAVADALTSTMPNSLLL